MMRTAEDAHRRTTAIGNPSEAKDTHLMMMKRSAPMRTLTLPALVVLVFASTAGTLFARGSQEVSLTIHSTPEGAVVSENGKVLGSTPVTLRDEFPDFTVCQTTKQLTLTWTSGATTSSLMTLCPAQGTSQFAEVARPAAVAGIEIDLEVAFQREVLARMDAATRAAGAPQPTCQPVTMPRP